MIVSHLLILHKKNTALYLYVWSLKCGKRSQSSRGPNTFARHCIYIYSGAKNIQWGKKVFSQPPIVQVLPLKKMREAFHHRYTSTMTDKMREKKSRKSHCRIVNEFICKLWWKISIWSATNKQEFWLSQTCNFFFKRLLCPPLVTCINGTCLNLLSV